MQLKGNLQNDYLVISKYVNSMKVKERQKNCSREEDTKETWQLNARHDAEWELVAVENVIRIIGGTEEWMVVMNQC